MDGTLLDTEVLARQCFDAACADLGLIVESGVYDRCVGTNWETTERIIRSACPPDFPYPDLIARWSERYHAVVAHEAVPIKPGIQQLLHCLSERHVPLGVATSTQREVVETKLRLAGLDHYFVTLVCGGETKRGKPHPDPYQRALTDMSLPASQCWAVEDSDNGVRSAYAAGLTVIQIPDELTPAPEIVKMGHKILSSALDLLPHLL